jgi:threonine/homoserine/homoserine lactone efflux protein
MDGTWPTTLATFCAAAGLLTIAPGVDTALVIRTASRQGRRASLSVTLGIALGCVSWSAAVAFGVATLLAASAQAYATLKWAGGAYLVWLGVRLLTARHVQCVPDQADTLRTTARTGFLSNILNPKTGVFYVSFLPQFVPAGAPVVPTMLALGTIHALMAVVWLSLVAFAASSFKQWLSRASIVGTFDKITGLVFVVLGLRLALADRR